MKCCDLSPLHRLQGNLCTHTWGTSSHPSTLTLFNLTPLCHKVFFHLLYMLSHRSEVTLPYPGSSAVPVAEPVGADWIYLHVNNTNLCPLPLQATGLAQWQELLLDETTAWVQTVLDLCVIWRSHWRARKFTFFSTGSTKLVGSREREHQHL